MEIESWLPCRMHLPMTRSLGPAPHILIHIRKMNIRTASVPCSDMIPSFVSQALTYTVSDPGRMHLPMARSLGLAPLPPGAAGIEGP